MFLLLASLSGLVNESQNSLGRVPGARLNIRSACSSQNVTHFFEVPRRTTRYCMYKLSVLIRGNSSDEGSLTVTSTSKRNGDFLGFN